MILKLFKSNSPLILFLIPIIAFALWFKVLFSSATSSIVFTAPILPLAQLFNTIFASNIHILIVSSLSFLILLSFLLIKLNSEFINIENRTSFSALIFLAIIGGSPQVQVNPFVIYAAIFMYLALYQIFCTYKTETRFSYFFNAGFFIATGSLFYSKLIFFLPTILIGVGIIRAFNWREWFVLFIGVFTPYILALSYLYLTDDLNKYIIGFSSDLIGSSYIYQIKLHNLIFYSYLLFIGVISTFNIYSIVGTKKIGIRKNVIILVWMVINSIILFLVFHPYQFEILYFLAIPFSIFISNYLVSDRAYWIKEILFTLFIATIIYSQIN